MKIQVVSDLHLEFGPITIENNGADVLILSGDICVADGFNVEQHKERYNSFFNFVCKEFKYVVYVLGNHEHYHGNFATSARVLREELSRHVNLHILDNSYVDIDDVRFVGGTLWTDFDKHNPTVMWDAQRMMNDYRGVQNGTLKFLPSAAIEQHEVMLNIIDEQSSQHEKIVVVGHHAPSMQSISGRYVGHSLNGAYASDLVSFILNKPSIKLWTHGHIHTCSDYMIGTTRIVCNPRGYQDYEENEEFDSGKVVEV